jgi:hypothetical protein
VFINADMKMPGAGVYRQIPVEHGNFLGLLSEANFKDCPLNAGTKDNLVPVLLEECAKQFL